MINKNSSGGNLSANYDDYISQPAREFRVRILINGSELSCAISQMVITKGSCGNPESFTVGNIVTSTMTAELKDVSVPIKGKTLQVQVGLFTGSVYEYVTMGYFVATEVSVTAYKTIVVAYGATSSKTNGSFVIPSTLSLANIASAVSTATGATVSFGSSIDTSKVINGELPVGCSCYQALQILASVVGGYCMDTYNGGIVIKTFSATTTLSVDSGRMIILPSVGELPFNISGVKVVVTEATESEEGSVIPEVSYEYPQGGNIVLYDTNPYMSAGCFAIYRQIVGYSYRNGNVRLSLGDPRIEGDDVLSVSDVSGETYVVPCHQVTHTYDGGFSTVVVASKPTSQADGIVTTTPISQRIDVIASASEQAQASAELASAAVVQIQGDVERATELLDDMEDAAEQAGTTLTQIFSDAMSAKTSAEDAQVSANRSSIYASSALDQLNIVQNVVGVLDLLSTNASYERTTDAEVIEGKWYFTRSGESPDYVYSVVETPTTAGIANYYEIVSIDEAVQNYVTSRLTVTADGLWLQDPTMATKVLLSSTDGVVLYGADGTIVGKYGSTAQIGDSAGFHIEMNGTELGFYQGSNKVAYINNNQLYITKSVVLQQMDLGTQAIGGGLGQWSWKIHPNGEIPSRNNLNLKWVG